MSEVSTSTRIRAVILGLSVLLVAGLWRAALRQSGARDGAAAPGTSSTTGAGASSTTTASASDAPSSSALAAGSGGPGLPGGNLADAGGPVYLRLNEIRLAHPGSHVRGHLRANINAAYYDFPSDPVDGGPSWIELGDSTHGKFFQIPRSVSYEVYFEIDLARSEKISSDPETLNLTSPSGALSDKVPFTEEYKLYMTGHGMRASEPTAVLSYTITETP